MICAAVLPSFPKKSLFVGIFPRSGSEKDAINGVNELALDVVNGYIFTRRETTR
jgi:hypothetical protein